jgi:hypothetical protein
MSHAPDKSIGLCHHVCVLLLPRRSFEEIKSIFQSNDTEIVISIPSGMLIQAHPCEVSEESAGSSSRRPMR